MQGLWKNSVSHWNNKDIKRKKQSLNHFFKDKIRGIYKNTEDIRANSNKNKNSTLYKSKSVKVDVLDTKTSEYHSVQYIRFKRQIRLSDTFSKRNCSTCPFNAVYKEEDNMSYLEIEDFFTKKKKEINSNFGITEYYGIRQLSYEAQTERHAQLKEMYQEIIVKKSQIRRKKWCSLDIYSSIIKFDKNYYYKQFFVDKPISNGCLRTDILDYKLEYKVFKVIQVGSYYYQVYNKDKLYDNRRIIDSSWSFDKVIKDTDNTVKLYDVEVEYKKEYIGSLSYKGNSIPYKEKKRLEAYYYCKNNKEFYSNKILRSKNKSILNNTLENLTQEYPFIHNKMSFYGYC